MKCMRPGLELAKRLQWDSQAPCHLVLQRLIAPGRDLPSVLALTDALSLVLFWSWHWSVT